MDEGVTVSIRMGRRLWKAFEVVIKEPNVYVNYFIRDRSRHTSYHASGQHHIKNEKGYVQWTGGPSGDWEPMKQFKKKPLNVEGRERVSSIGWCVSQNPSALAPLADPTEMVVDASNFRNYPWVLTFEISILGPSTEERLEILGFPVVQRHRIGQKILVEIEAFLVTEDNVA